MPRRAYGRTKINIYFQDDVLEALRRLALLEGTTYSELIRKACRKYAVSEGGRVVQENGTIRELTK